jgi:methylated-DNA-protein-cysteine methyltransferase-like protein
MGVTKKTKSQTIKPRSGAKRKAKSGGCASKLQAPAPAPNELIWQVVAMIPQGKVATYGQLAALIGFPSHARLVGRTLRNLPADSKLPWFRVVNAGMRISLTGGGEARQKRLLEAEGVTFIGKRIANAHRWEAG